MRKRYAWTTDRDRALWFHDRNQGYFGWNPMIDGREEHEVVCKPVPRFWK